MRRLLAARRLPIRLRVTLAFSLVMAVVLLATGLFLYLRFASELDRTINAGLRSRAGDVAALVQQADSGLRQSGGSQLVEQGESFAQILEAGGAVFDATPQLRSRPLLDGPDLRLAARGTVISARDRLPGVDGPARLLATPVRAQGQTLIVVVGTALEERAEALENLVRLLLVGGPAALVLASLAGYGVAAGALAPVERMRRRAAEISASRPGQRLPVPASRDEIGRLGETLNEMLDRLEVAFARERRFVTDASHELRTPLAILKAELELALRAGRDPDELRGAVRSAAEETDRLIQLAEDLLVIARSDQGRLPVRTTDLSVREVCEQVAGRFRRRAGDERARIDVDAPEHLVIRADVLRLEQALGNLLDNALRHGGRTIRLSGLQRDGWVDIHVSDDGPGFPPEFIASAFERFTRADPARGRGGAGLGLAIVAAIAHAHGGEVRAANVDGGADVRISLPRHDAS